MILEVEQGLAEDVMTLASRLKGALEPLVKVRQASLLILRDRERIK